MVIVIDRDILHQISRETTSKEVEVLGLIRHLREANKTAWTEGCGLAAIQIGFHLRFAWFLDAKGKERNLLNPVIVNRWGLDIQKEGCLSIPNKFSKVSRAWTIEYITNGRKKKVSGFEARLIQHEIDHMDGILNDEKEVI